MSFREKTSSSDALLEHCAKLAVGTMMLDVGCGEKKLRKFLKDKLYSGIDVETDFHRFCATFKYDTVFAINFFIAEPTLEDLHVLVDCAEKAVILTYGDYQPSKLAEKCKQLDVKLEYHPLTERPSSTKIVRLLKEVKE